MIYCAPIYLILLVCVFILAHEFFWGQPVVNAFQCPPCGCSQDAIIFSEPGTCPNCQMHLFTVSESVKQVSFASYWMNDNYGKLYHKFLYPAFFMGLLLGLLFLIKRKGRSYFLGGFVLVLALYGFKHQLYGVEYGLTANYRFQFIPVSFITALGPLAFFYFSSQLDRFRWKPHYFVHFLPAALFFLAYLIPLLGNDQLKAVFLSSPFEPVFSHPEQIAAILLLLLYLYLISFKLELQKNKSEATNNFKWLNRFYFGCMALCHTWAVMLTINFTYFQFGIATSTNNPLWVVMSALVYWVILETLINPKILSNYAGNGFGYSMEKIESDKLKVKEIMVEKSLYLDPNLSLDKLAKETGFNNKYLSLVLNLGFNKNFFEFINEYRVERVKQLLVHPDYQHFTIVAIANEAGFNSKSTFNSIFKKYTKLTPREYLRSCALND